jgi:Na+-driven multidrug efflux pump
MGAGRADLARRTTLISVGLAFFLMFGQCGALMALKHTLAELFSTDPNVVQIVVNTMPLVVAFNWLDGICPCCFNVEICINFEELV